MQNLTNSWKVDMSGPAKTCPGGPTMGRYGPIRPIWSLRAPPNSAFHMHFCSVVSLAEWIQSESNVKSKWILNEIKMNSMWNPCESEWNPCGINVKSESYPSKIQVNQNEIIVSGKWAESELIVKAKWNHSEFEVSSKWNQSETRVRSKWNQSESMRVNSMRNQCETLRPPPPSPQSSYPATEGFIGIYKFEVSGNCSGVVWKFL